MDARGGGDVDNAAWLAVFDTEVGGRSTNELEGCGAVQGNDGVPLLVGDLVDHTCVVERYQCLSTTIFYGISGSCALTIPCKASVVDDDVNLAIAKLCRSLD